jgi:uncharacterized protein DUF4431
LKYKLTIIILVVLAATNCLQVRAQEKQWLSYEPATVELQGRLIVQWKYGPPNFGEQPKTDQRVKVPILVLTRSINVRGTPGDAHNANSVEGARRVQLTFSNLATDYKQLVGKNVVVKGTLFHAFSGQHYTDVVMDVRSIELEVTAVITGANYYSTTLRSMRRSGISQATATEM